MDDLIYFLIVGGLIIFFNVIGIIAMFNGDFYRKDEEILKKYPHSRRAQAIEEKRRKGTYDIYVPYNERENYIKRYLNGPPKESSVKINEDKKGGE